MRKIFRARNVFLALAVLIVGWQAEFTYRLNNVCDRGDHITQSDADAIKQAQIQIVELVTAATVYPDMSDEKPGYADFSQADCCTVRRSRTIFGVIIWEVRCGETVGEPKKRRVTADMWLSNCGAVFDENSSITAEPIR